MNQPYQLLFKKLSSTSQIQNAALDLVIALRWPQGPVCPRCQSQEYRFLKTRSIWECKGCKKQYSVKLGTIFEDSAVKLDKWLCAIWMIVNAKNGVSSYEIARTSGCHSKDRMVHDASDSIGSTERLTR